jgi:predicted dehydrogenase
MRAAVVGLGAMGSQHCRVFSDLPDVELVGVADLNAGAVARATRGRVLPGYTDPVAMLERERPDMISVAVPTSLHHDIACQALERGVHVLVEKPVASTLAEAWSMIQVAERSGSRLMVGHIERFNPAIIELKRRLDQVGVIFQIMARRLGPFPDRIRDVGVVVDLASHDIDAMRFLLDLLPERLYAETAQRVHSSHEDMIVGTIRFAGGVIGALDVNWLTPTKIRELVVVGSRGTFVANYLTQDLSFHENGLPAASRPGPAATSGIGEGNAVRYAFQRKEPLRSELEAFVAYARDGGACPISPVDAAETLAIAHGLIESARLGAAVPYRSSIAGAYASVAADARRVGAAA